MWFRAEALYGWDTPSSPQPDVSVIRRPHWRNLLGQGMPRPDHQGHKTLAALEMSMVIFDNARIREGAYSPVMDTVDSACSLVS
jgi:hypothetical protein